MVDVCDITEPPVATFDPATGQASDTPGDLVYTGRCALAEAGGTGADVFQLRGAELESRRFYLLSIPRDAPAPRPGHHVTMTATVDLSLDENRLTVRKTRYGTRMARRILLCEMIEVVDT